MTCKGGQFDVELMVNDQFNTFSINLNAQRVNGMTHFDLTEHRGKLVKIHGRLLDTLSTTKLGQFSQRKDTTTVGFHLQFMAEKY